MEIIYYTFIKCFISGNSKERHEVSFAGAHLSLFLHIMSNDPGRSQIDERGKQSKDKIHGHRNLLRKNLHDATDSPISGQSDARLHTSKTVIDTKSRHDGESQHVNTQAKEVDPSKLEQAHTKRQDHPNISSSTSEEHESEGSVNPQPFNIESISGKGQHSTGDHPQTVQPKPTRPTPRTNPYFPPGAAPPRYHYEHPSTTATTITSHRGSTTTSDKSDADHARVATPSAANPQPEVVPDKVDEQKAPPTNAGVPTKIPSDPDQRESPQTQLNSETTKTDVPTSQDGLAAGVFGGIANALGMRPLTSREAQLQKDNHKLKEHNKHLRTENYEVEMAARKYYQEACRLHHENERIKETLEAMTLEVKGITRRYEEAKSLSDTRGKELLGAQTFLTKADGLSISELIHKVDGLNDEIYQVSASLSETIVQKNIELSEQISVSPEDSSTAKALLGSLLCKVLRSRARRPDEGIHPLLVQITLQAFFSMFCVARIRSWNSDINFDLALQGLYEKIRSSSE